MLYGVTARDKPNTYGDVAGTTPAWPRAPRLLISALTSAPSRPRLGRGALR
jgi:hypothetical protein